MRSLEEIKVVKDFMIFINSFENVRDYANLSYQEQIYKYIQDNHKPAEYEGILLKHMRMFETETPFYCSLTTDRMVNIVMKLTEEEASEYTRKCNYSGAWYLKEDMTQLEDDLWVNDEYVINYERADDDNRYHKKSEMIYVDEDDIYIYSSEAKTNYKMAIDDGEWHHIDNLTRVFHFDSPYDCSPITRYVYSQDYLDHNYVIPEDKEFYVNRDVCVYICDCDDVVLDRDYLDEHYDFCNHCDEWYPRDGYEHGEWLDNYDEWVCEDCLTRHYVRCESCNSWIHDGDEYYDEDDEDEEHCLCSNCYNSGGPQRIDRNENLNAYVGGYHCNHGVWESYKLEEETNPPFYIGFELEVEPKRNSEYNATKAAKSALNHIHCILSHDGSLNQNGFEIVSQPQTYEYVMKEYDKYKECFDEIVKNGYVSHNSRNCGLHFHVTAPTQNRSRAVARLWLIIESFKEEFQKLSRRKGNFSYCEFLSDRSYDSDGKFKSIYKIAKVSEMEKEQTRYLTINDQNEKTVEIRLFKGTLNINTFFADLQLVNNLFTLAYDIERPITEIKFSDLIQGEYISQYCSENSIYTEKQIIDESEKYVETEKKMMRLVKNILDMTWRYIEESKDIQVKIINKKNVNSKEDPFQARNDVQRMNNRISYAVEYYCSMLRMYRANNIPRIINIFGDMGLYLDGMDSEEKTKIRKKMNKVKEYYNQL